MITLHPVPDVDFACPACSARLVAHGWYVPGMRALARLECPSCSRQFYGDLGVAQALYTPMLLDVETGEVHDPHGVPWFARWLRDSYAARVSDDLDVTVRELRPVVRPLLLNCIDRLYGHAVLKLFNAQHYLDHHPDRDLIVLVPRYLAWLVPDGVAEVWTVDLPLRRGAEWNDALASRIAERISGFESCAISVALPHPHPGDVAIERFTRVKPAGEDLWRDVPRRPAVAFIWRDDRVWSGPETPMRRLTERLGRAVGSASQGAQAQRARVIALAESLRVAFPKVSFRVIGPGTPGDLPEWIGDERAGVIDEGTERRWCELYAASHLTIGIHGSNMLLPSAHAGAVLELVPHDRWGNYLQDLHVRRADPREAMIHTRLVPDALEPEAVASIAASILTDRNAMMLNLGREMSRHASAPIASFVELRRRLRDDAEKGGAV